MGVLEELEEEEVENRKMVNVRLFYYFDDEDDDNEEKQFLFQKRFVILVRVQRQYVRQYSYRKRYFFFNDFLFYNIVMDYFNSDDFDGEGNIYKKLLEFLIEGSQVSIDKKSESFFTYQEMDVRLYRGINQLVFSVARSDGDIENRNSVRYKVFYQIFQLGKLFGSKINSRSLIKRDESIILQETSRSLIRRDEFSSSFVEYSRGLFRRFEFIILQDERIKFSFSGVDMYDKKFLVGDNIFGIVQMGIFRGFFVQFFLFFVELGILKLDGSFMDIFLISFIGILQRQKFGRIRIISQCFCF